jgi:hypothetical protein
MFDGTSLLTLLTSLVAHARARMTYSSTLCWARIGPVNLDAKAMEIVTMRRGATARRLRILVSLMSCGLLIQPYNFLRLPFSRLERPSLTERIYFFF